jgi:protein phosphatase
MDVTDPSSERDGTAWWMALTENGGEGMVVKPADFILRGRRGLAQPAVKCRGREYLRIIYGPDYTTEENLSRLERTGRPEVVTRTTGKCDDHFRDSPVCSLSGKSTHP